MTGNLRTKFVDIYTGQILRIDGRFTRLFGIRRINDMPFKSKAQQRFMFAKHPEIAEEFAHATPNIKKLPEHVKENNRKHHPKEPKMKHEKHEKHEAKKEHHHKKEHHEKHEDHHHMHHHHKEMHKHHMKELKHHEKMMHHHDKSKKK